jgi:peptidoglycan-associated lipoprotein
MYKKILVPAFLVLAVAAGGCASSGSKGSSARQPDASSSQPYGSSGDISNRPAQIGPQGGDASAMNERSLSNNIVYFDFDKSEIKSEYAGVVTAFAKYLSAHPSTKVRLEGHTDERGTREYNVGLGERRANAVQAALTAQGVAAGQISVISYGEERPADPGHTETAWAKNRRVQIIRQ